VLGNILGGRGILEYRLLGGLDGTWETDLFYQNIYGNFQVMLFVVELFFWGRSSIDFLLEFTDTNSTSLQGSYLIEGEVSFVLKPNNLFYKKGLAIIIRSRFTRVINRSEE
jgi:hypothetical protein